MKEIDIFLIHGTFAKNAEWVKDQSIFCQNLKEGINGNVRFHQYHWDGKNSFKSRYKEGVKLGKKVESINNDESIKVLIGHSHGGNVGLYSLSTCKEIDLVVTLGTPFIISKLKHTIKAVYNYTKFFTAIFLGMMCGFLFEMLFNAEESFFIIVFMIFCLSLMGGLFYFYSRVKNKVVNIVKSFKKEIEYLRSMDVNIVNVQYDFDEANFFLNLINEKIRPISKSIYFVLNKLNNIVFACIFVAMFFMILDLMAVIDVYDSIFDIVFVVIFLLMFPAFFMIVYFPISLLLNGLSFNKAALGSYPMFLTFFLKIEVSKHLNDIFDSATDYILKPSKKGGVGLNHSMYYLDPKVADIVVGKVNELTDVERGS